MKTTSNHPLRHVIAPLLLALPLFMLGAADATLDAPRSSPRVKGTEAPPAPSLALGDKAAVRPPPYFSEQPTEAEFFAVQLFETPVISVGESSPQENKALAGFLTAHAGRSESEDASHVLEFLRKFPESVFKPSLLLNLGIHWRQSGNFSRALQAWEEAWQLTRHEKEPQVKAMADSILGELVQLLAWVGRYERLEPLLAEVQHREIIGGATERISGARQGLWMMNHQPEVAFKCGPCALHQIGSAQDPKFDVQKLFGAKSPRQGFSLSQLQKMSEDWDLNYQMIKRQPGSAIPVPSVIHWKLDHYSAILKTQKGRYLIQDSTFSHLYGQELWVSKEAIEEESSGYFLVPKGTTRSGWESIEAIEGNTVWGKGITCCQNPDDFTPEDEKPCQNDTGEGLAQYSAHLMLVSLNIVDTPVGYTPPRGPAVKFTATYNQRDSYSIVNPSYSNLGSKWTFNWFTYIIDNGETAPAPVTAIRYVGGGGRLKSQVASDPAILPVTYNPDQRGNILQRTAANTYVLTFPDGAQHIFGYAPQAGAQRKVYLTQSKDPFGNTVTLSYQTQGTGLGRLNQITDSLGQVTTFHYDLSAKPYLITRVEDPFTRIASFEYDSLDRLRKITDVVGLFSIFTYLGNTDFVTNLTTPYGTTTFSFTDEAIPNAGVRRSLDITDSNGDREKIHFQHAGPGPFSEPGTEIPDTGGYGVFNQHLYQRNTYYFDKKAMHDYPAIGSNPMGHYDKAWIYHWLHDNVIDPVNSHTSGILESMKPPLESRIWYVYPGTQSPGFNQGITLRKPIVMARMVDDANGNPVSQTHKFTYNSIGNITSYTDPRGRQTTFDYQGNDIDLWRIRQTAPGASETLLEFGKYNQGWEAPIPNPNTAPHRPESVTDASRRITLLQWDRPTGKLKKIINANLEYTYFNYYTDGSGAKTFLNSIQEIWWSPSGGGSRITSFTWDTFGRVRTATDESEGYTLTYYYDAMDRLTKVLYPDQSYEKFTYGRLDLVRYQDRRGRQTELKYDGTGRLTTMKDPLGRLTQYGWCGCGGLDTITDPLAHTTTWIRDARGRILTKRYHDNREITYTYETRSGKLKTMVDAKSQKRTFSYFSDGRIDRVSYSHLNTPPPAPPAYIAVPDLNFTYDLKYPRISTMTYGTEQTVYGYNPVTGAESLGAGRLATIDGPLANDTIQYGYDILGRIVSRNINGVGESVTYDALGRVTSHVTPLGSPGTFTPTYVGATRRLTSLSYPNGQTTTFDYWDNLHDKRLKEIWHKQGGTTISRFIHYYDKDGLLREQDRLYPGGGTAEVYEYDTADQLITVANWDVNSGVILDAYTHAYDSAGNRTGEQQDSRWGSGSGPWTKITKSTYNTVNQLTARSASDAAPVRFLGQVNEPATVTLNGQPAMTEQMKPGELGYTPSMRIFSGSLNLTPGTTPQIAIHAQDPNGNTAIENYQLTVNGGVARTAITYDNNGNCTGFNSPSGNVTYDWDAADRLVAVHQGSLHSEFTYNGYGRCVRIVEKNGTTITSEKRFVWYGLTRGEERDGSGNVTKRFYPEGVQVAGASLFYTLDRLGSIRELTDSTGAVRARYDYDPYGRRTKSTGDLEADFGFTGQYYHAPSKLHLAVYRAYDADVGRWINRDPVAEAGGLNLYRYVKNSPTRYTDSLGLSGIMFISYKSGDWNESGHIWIDFFSDSGEYHTYGLRYTPRTGVGLTEDLELMYTADSTRGAFIDDEGERRFYELVGEQSRHPWTWGPFNNCANFGVNAWRAATGESLAPLPEPYQDFPMSGRSILLPETVNEWINSANNFGPTPSIFEYNPVGGIINVNTPSIKLFN